MDSMAGNLIVEDGRGGATARFDASTLSLIRRARTTIKPVRTKPVVVAPLGLPQWIADQVPNAKMFSAPIGASFVGSIVVHEQGESVVQIAPKAFVRIQTAKLAPEPALREHVRFSPTASGTLRTVPLKGNLTFVPVDLIP